MIVPECTFRGEMYQNGTIVSLLAALKLICTSSTIKPLPGSSCCPADDETLLPRDFARGLQAPCFKPVTDDPNIDKFSEALIGSSWYVTIPSHVFFCPLGSFFPPDGGRDLRHFLFIWSFDLRTVWPIHIRLLILSTLETNGWSPRLLLSSLFKPCLNGECL